MATKPLKTITFEGLEDTYTIPQIDDTLSVTGGAADAKVTGDSLKAKAEAEGAVSMAKALVGGKYTLDQSPYHYRQSPDAGALDEKIVGGTLAWNQLCNSSSVTVQTGHKYLSKIGGTYSVGSSTGTAITGLTSGTDMVFDLTALFNPTIADYIYSLEQATAGAGVAWFRNYFPKDYYPYDKGTLRSVEGVSAHETVGFNQWDEEWESGHINNSTGEFVASQNYIRTKNFISIVPGKSYYIKTPVALKLVAYDSNKTFLRAITSTWANEVISGSAHLSDVYYIKFYNAASGALTTYNHDICINISDPSRNGTYEPYEKHSYPLDSSIELRGMPKLSDGKMYFDGDEYQSDGQVVRRYGIVDLGSLEWILHNNEYSIYKCKPPGMAIVVEPPYTNRQIGAVCSAYVPSEKFAIYGSMSDKSWLREGNEFYIRDTAYTDATSFKTAMSGVMLVYELATPTTETAQPFQSPMIVGTTEEYISDSVVPVGHESKYYEDVAKKVSGLPKDFSTLIAPTEVTFTATRNYSIGNYLIVKNQLYKATSAISSGGTITPNSNVTATTIMAEILALA